MFLSTSFSIILVNQDPADSHFSMHSLDATKCRFYPLLQRDLFDDIAHIFKSLGDQATLSRIEDLSPIIERFTVLLYNRTSNCLATNECRKDSRKNNQ